MPGCGLLGRLSALHKAACLRTRWHRLRRPGSHQADQPAPQPRQPSTRLLAAHRLGRSPALVRCHGRRFLTTDLRICHRCGHYRARWPPTAWHERLHRLADSFLPAAGYFGPLFTLLVRASVQAPAAPGQLRRTCTLRLAPELVDRDFSSPRGYGRTAGWAAVFVRRAPSTSRLVRATTVRRTGFRRRHVRRPFAAYALRGYDRCLTRSFRAGRYWTCAHHHGS